MTLQSRLLGVFAQYPDPRVGFYVHEIIGGAIYGVWGINPDVYQDPNVELEEAEITRGSLSLPDQAHPFDQNSKYDALVPWLARLVASLLKQRRRGELSNHLFGAQVGNMGRSLDEVVDWAHATHPNLMNLTWGDGLHRTAEWLRTLSTTRKEKKTKPVTGEVVFRFGDGWTVQRLTTMAQLKAETIAMRHCVGASDVYFQGIQAGLTAIFSMRDAKGYSAVTFEVATVPAYATPEIMDQLRAGGPFAGILRQAKLPHNRLPDTPQICHRIQLAADQLGWIYKDTANLHWVRDLHSCRDLPTFP